MNDIKKKRFVRLILKWVFSFILILFIIDIIPAFFYKREVNVNVLPSYYKKGVYHMHSVFSDGKGDVNEITAAAKAVGLDFVILTDHGRPNRGSLSATSWRNDVLVVGGTEFSLISGHLAAMGLDLPGGLFAVEPQEAIDDVINSNGVCFPAHPFDDKIPWTDWGVKGFTGLEVYSSYNEARRAGILKFLVFPFKFLVNSRYALLNTMSYPGDSMAKWDLLNKKGKCYGIYALDVHGKLEISDGLQLNFPSYRSMFEIMTVYVNVGDGFVKDAGVDAARVISALRKGNFFNAIEGIASANGFDAFFMYGEKGNRLDMGGVCEWTKGKLVVLLPFDFETNVLVLKDGKVFKRFDKNKEKRLEVVVNEGGVYRVEVFARGNSFDELPWITSNPFYVGMGSPLLFSYVPVRDSGYGVVLKREIPGSQDVFMLEKNGGSEGSIFYERSVLNESVTGMRFRLAEGVGEKSFWCSMALRKKLDFSKFKGVVLDVKSDKKRRFMVELRSDDRDPGKWYSYSFFADKEWRRVYIPFERLHVNFKEKVGIDVSHIESVFISANDVYFYPGTEGVLYIKNFGVSF
jgi:hypothetical protein